MSGNLKLPFSQQFHMMCIHWNNKNKFKNLESQRLGSDSKYGSSIK